MNCLEKKHNYFYRITNQLDWKYYFGIHSTDKNPDDDNYYGSGTIIRNVISKYGRKNFVKTIIADYSTRLEVVNHEKLAITIHQISDPMCYNIQPGGSTSKGVSDEVKKILKEKRQNQIITKESRIKAAETRRNNGKPWFPESHKQKLIKRNTGRKNSDETKEKMRQRKLGVSRSEAVKEQISLNSKQSIKCFVEGIVYRSVVQVSNTYNLSVGAVQYRIKSNKEKWKEWQFFIE